ncbi:hypothetical protein ACHAXN_002822 [Cyclotella atomus]
MGNTPSTGSPSSRNSTDRTAGGGSSSLSSTLTEAATNLTSRITGGGSNNNAGASRHHIPSISSFSPFRGTGSLGLTKAELDTACTPSGLYPTCEWDSKQIRRLIGDGRLAPRLKGSDSRCTKSDRECPICFMLYSQSNVTKCCEATICTECYLQIKTPKEKNTTCPFCNCPKMMVVVQKAMDEDAIAKREEEEQRVIESIIRNRVAQVNGEMPLHTVPTSPSSESDGSNEFGSSLEQYNRSRTFSNSSSGAISEASSSSSCHTPIKSRSAEINDNDALLSLAMSPDARYQLEQEMAAQLSHETHQRMEMEAEEARVRHAEEWSRTDSGMRSRMREARIAELTALLERMSQNNNTESGEELGGLFSALDYGGRGGGNNRGSALENIMRLEAAFLNATGESGEGRRRPMFRRGSSERMGNDNTNEDNRYNSFSIRSPRRVVRGMPRRGVSTTHLETAEMLMRGISEEEQLAMAIAMSMQENTRQQQQGQQEQQQQQNEQQQSDGQVAESSQGAQVAPGLETHEEAQSDRSGSSSDSDSDADEVNNMQASNPSLADGEEEVVFERDSSHGGDLV